MAQNLSLQEQISLPTAVWAQMRDGYLAATRLRTIATNLCRTGNAALSPQETKDRAHVATVRPQLERLMEYHQTQPKHTLHPSHNDQITLTMLEFDFHATEVRLLYALAHPLQKEILNAKRAFLDAAGSKRVPHIPPSPLSIATKNALTAHEAWMILATQDTVAKLMKEHLAESKRWAWAVQRPLTLQPPQLPPPQHS